MMKYVVDFLEGRMPRWAFDIDYSHHIMKRYPKMYREFPDFAEAFEFYIGECGVDCGDGLSDASYKKLIRKQYKALMTAASDGLF